MLDHQQPGLARMVAEVELDAIRCLGISARARDGFVLPEPSGDDDVPVQMNVKLHIGSGTLNVRIRAEVLSTDAQVVLDYEATHTAPRVLEYGPPLIGEFVANVTVPAIFPFLREGLAEITRRIGVTPQLLTVLLPQPDEEWVHRLTEQAASLQADAIAGAGQAVTHPEPP